MPVKRCENQSPTEGEPDEVRSLDPQCAEEPRKAVGVAIHAEFLRGISPTRRSPVRPRRSP